MAVPQAANLHMHGWQAHSVLPPSVSPYLQYQARADLHLQGKRTHLAGVGVAALALHLSLHQRVVHVGVHVADAATQLRQAAPRVAAQLVEYLRQWTASFERLFHLLPLSNLHTCSAHVFRDHEPIWFRIVPLPLCLTGPVETLL